MRSLVNIVALIVSLSGAGLRAEWRELKDESGACIQVAIDFSVEKVKITPDGNMQFVARTTDAGPEFGVAVAIEKPKESHMKLYGGGEYPVMQIGIEFRSIGEPTAKLERRLIERLHDRSDVEEPSRIAGLYSAYSSHLDAGFSGLMVLHVRAVGISYDDKGKQIAGDGFRTELVIDVPMGRMTAYFSIQGGYGGTAPADKARAAWLEKNKTANQFPEPAPSAAH
jgi:hypothetical protein